MKKILIVFISLLSCVNVLAEKTSVRFYVKYKNENDWYYSGTHYETNYTYGQCNGVWYVKDKSFFAASIKKSREDYDRIVERINSQYPTAITDYVKTSDGQTIWFN